MSLMPLANKTIGIGSLTMPFGQANPAVYYHKQTILASDNGALTL